MSEPIVACQLSLDTCSAQNTPNPPNLPSPTLRSIGKSSISGMNANSSMGLMSPARRKSSSISPNDDSLNLNALELEAIAAVHDMRALVKDLYVSDKLPRTPDLIYLNLTTTEGQPFCVELTALRGWRVSSLRHDCMNGDIGHLDLHIRYFDSMHSLMDHVSPGYAKVIKEIMATAALTAGPAVLELDTNGTTYEEETNGVCSDHQTFT